MLQNPLELTPVVIVTRRDERGEQVVGALHSGSSKGSEKNVLRKQGANLTNLCCVIKIFLCPLQMISILFACFLHFPSLVATI